MKTRQRLFCLDFENTLVPEFWPIVAKKTGIDELRITSQDLPNQVELMQRRVEILHQNDIRMPELMDIVWSEKPLDGAIEFIARLRHHSPRIIIVSDFAEQLAAPLVDRFDNITFFGHTFAVFPDGRISHYIFRQDNPKQKVVEAMRSLNFEVYAAGDSYNDIVMLETADKGYFINAPRKIQSEFPQFRNAKDFDQLYEWLTAE